MSKSHATTQTTHTSVIITDPPLVPPFASPLDDRKRSKKSKVRSAWISFVGRILAQVVGATAAVLLAVMVLQSQANPARNADEAAPSLATAPVTVGVDRIRRAPREASVAVLPLDNFSGDSRNDALANAFTEALIAALSNEPGVRVLSRTSSVYYGRQGQSLTELARRMDVDWVVEGALVTQGGRSRVIVQLIDAPADEHAWAATYDRPTADALSLQSSLAPPVAREIARVLTARRSREAGSEPAIDGPSEPAASARLRRR